MDTIIKKLRVEHILVLMRPHHFDEIQLKGLSLSLTRTILEQTARLAPMGDDEVRSLRVDVKGGDGKIHWFRFRTSVYRDTISLDILDERNMSIMSLTNKDFVQAPFYDYDYLETFLSGLLEDLTALIDSICKDASSYNEYVEKNLPKQFRCGRIPRGKLVGLIPEFKLSVTEPGVARQGLIAIIGNRTPTLRKMTIKEYCKWYRIAFNAFLSYKETEDEKRKYSDIEFYDLHSTCCPDAIRSGGYDIDSEKDFIEFAKGHYGEIGLTRCNVFARAIEPRQWKIDIDSSYTVTTAQVLNIVAAMYKAGAPLYLYNPADFLAALDETDYFAVKPNVYHDHRNLNGEVCGGSLEIPFPDEIYDDLPPEETIWTKERLNAVISATEWEPLEKVKKNPSA